MLKLSLFAVMLAIALPVSAQRTFEYKDGDSVYVMKEYFMVFLKNGPMRDSIDAEIAKTTQPKHLEYLGGLYKKGLIVLNGPYGDNGDLRGMSLYAVTSSEEAVRLASEDPLVKLGWLAVEVHPWWGAIGTCLK